MIKQFILGLALAAFGHGASAQPFPDKFKLPTCIAPNAQLLARIYGEKNAPPICPEIIGPNLPDFPGVIKIPEFRPGELVPLPRGRRSGEACWPDIVVGGRVLETRPRRPGDFQGWNNSWDHTAEVELFVANRGCKAITQAFSLVLEQRVRGLDSGLHYDTAAFEAVGEDAINAGFGLWPGIAPYGTWQLGLGASVARPLLPGEERRFKLRTLLRSGLAPDPRRLEMRVRADACVFEGLFSREFGREPQGCMVLESPGAEDNQTTLLVRR